MNRRRKLLFTLALCGFALGLGEAAVRIRQHLRYGGAFTGETLFDFDPSLGLKVPRPGAKVNAERVSIHINSLGLRGDEITQTKPSGALRIACLGGSTNFCSEVSSNCATWPRQLQVRLQQQFPAVTIQVLNAGVPGYIIADSVKHFERYILPLDPDLVLVYHANNDMAIDTRALAMRRGLIQPDAGNVPPLIQQLSRYSLLVDLAYKNSKIWFGQADKAGGKLNGLPPDLPNHFIREIDQLHESLRRRDIPLILSTFLVKYRRGQDRAEQLQNADVAFYYMPWMSLDDLLDGIDAYNTALGSYANTHSLAIIADRDAIPADSIHFADCMHLTDAGCAAMADRVFRFLNEQRIVEQLIHRKIRSQP